ncbi:hypothetical protein GCM10028805_64240 [Spirosoma harenae]
MGPLDHLSLRYLRHALDKDHPIDEPYVLNPVESRIIGRAKAATFTLAALLGGLGIVLIYLPQYYWPELFSTTSLQWFEMTLELPIALVLYSLLLIYIEVNLLLAINAWGVKTIMSVCQFPRAHDAQYDRHLQELANAAIKKSVPGFLQFGVDPYLTLPRWGLTIFFLTNLVQAALTVFVLQFLLSQFLMPSILISVMVGAPVYALWNVWASWQVLHEAQVRVMAPTTIREFAHELHEEWGKNDQFRPLIIEALHYVSILNRPYNYAHYILTETLIDRFNLSADSLPTNQFIEKVQQAPASVRRSLERIIVFGVLIDGELSWVEKNRLRQLRKAGFMTYTAKEIQRIGADYNQGRGLWV